jgi:hypothetical protein
MITFLEELSMSKKKDGWTKEKGWLDESGISCGWKKCGQSVQAVS